MALLAPYSSYGRIASNLFAPVYDWGNNLLAMLTERAESYAFYETDVWIKGAITFAVATIQGFRIGIPGMALQVAGGYYFIKYILKK